MNTEALMVDPCDGASSGHRTLAGSEAWPRAAASPLQPDEFYFDRNNRMVFTATYLQRRGYCCGNGCRHCPYPKRR